MSTSQCSVSEPERHGRRGPVVRDTEAEPRTAACIAEKVRGSGGVKEVGAVCESSPDV